MASIDDSGHPLVFKLDDAAGAGFHPPPPPAAGGFGIRTYARALDGMQKEAVVACAPGRATWRMVCDEGPYLNGTDLAPFPLGFFTAGLAFSILSELTALLGEREPRAMVPTLVQDNRYTMSGSVRQGTMTGGALPVGLALEADEPAHAKAARHHLHDAVAASPACALLRGVLPGRFALTVNGEHVATDRVEGLARPIAGEPDDRMFDRAVPAAADAFAIDIIRKLEAAETVHGVPGGAGTSLAENQDRTLHVRGFCGMREDGLKETRTQLFSPRGSVFRFLSDDSAELGGTERAPSGLAYLSAGIAFCYLTQLGRYAHIARRPLRDYRIVQDTVFSLPGASANTGAPGTAEPVQTHVFVQAQDGPAYGRTLVDMGEQTCFLHAACRGAVKMKVGQAIEPELP